ncbi:MAG TPA: LysE family transporter [Halanaerobiales bacterium]|nr:LysE family transporter [Halanaerobiales bacterium]
MSLAVLFVSSFVVGLSGAMMPGPLLTYAINASFKKGYWAGPLLVAGHALLELLLIICLLLGLNQLFEKPVFTATIGIIGGGVLLWMGAGMLKSAIKREVSLKAEKEKATKAAGLIIPGIVISLSNPYWILWWATVGMTYLAHASRLGNAGTIAFYLGHISSDLLWYTLVSVLTVLGSKLISDRLYQVLVGVFAFLLIYFALVFITQGLNYYLPVII